mgnify:CR=1 FL=1
MVLGRRAARKFPVHLPLPDLVTLHAPSGRWSRRAGIAAHEHSPRSLVAVRSGQAALLGCASGPCCGCSVRGMLRHSPDRSTAMLLHGPARYGKCIYMNREHSRVTGGMHGKGHVVEQVMQAGSQQGCTAGVTVKKDNAAGLHGRGHAKKCIAEKIACDAATPPRFHLSRVYHVMRSARGSAERPAAAPRRAPDRTPAAACTSARVSCPRLARVCRAAGSSPPSIWLSIRLSA